MGAGFKTKICLYFNSLTSILTACLIKKLFVYEHPGSGSFHFYKRIRE
jgi:hypothetical protein